MAHDHNHKPHHAEHAHTPEQHDAPDTWHTHYSDEPQPQHAHGENIRSGQVFAFGLGGFLILIAVIVVVIVYFNWYKTSLEVQLVERAPFDPKMSTLGALNQEAETRRAQGPGNEPVQYRTLDRDKGVYQITLDKAMEKVVQQYQQPAAR